LQSLLAALRACTPDALQPLVSSRRAAVSTRFMLWLAGEAAAAEARGDADASALETLCGLVFVAREGCVSRINSSILSKMQCSCAGYRRLEDGRAVLAQLGSTDPCALPAAAPAALTQQGADARFEDFAALAQQLKPGSAGLEAELSKRWAALALRGEQEAPGQAGLNSASRRSSAAEIMGRAALDGAQPDEVLRPQAEVKTPCLHHAFTSKHLTSSLAGAHSCGAACHRGRCGAASRCRRCADAARGWRS
jgi:hypothetical protein